MLKRVRNLKVIEKETLTTRKICHLVVLTENIPHELLCQGRESDIVPRTIFTAKYLFWQTLRVNNFQNLIFQTIIIFKTKLKDI